MVLLFACITLVYLFLIGYLAFGIDKVNPFTLEDVDPKTSFSIIIPFRNEAESLPNLLASIEQLNYPKHLYEIILVDDASEDNSVEIIKSILKSADSHTKAKLTNISIIPNNRVTKAPKKDAITSAIHNAKYEWIVTTDADCTLPKFWLDAFDGYIQKHFPEFIVAPVTYINCNSFLKRFQLLDFLSLQGATLGGFGINKPFLSNGANLAYKKDLFHTLEGFSGNTSVASGDDIFLLEKALKHDSGNVDYLKNEHAIVYTKAQKDLKNLIAQRKRWASKTSRYNNIFAKFVGITVLLMNAALVCAIILSIVGSLSYSILFYLFIIKLSIDFLLLFKTARFFSQEQILPTFFLSSLIYPFFSVYIAVASMFSRYKWKGRAFSK